MAVYLVSYDLNRPGTNYSKLHEILKSYNWWHCINSTWMLQTNENAVSIANKLKEFMDANDSLLVIRVTNELSCWVPENCTLWLKKNL